MSDKFKNKYRIKSARLQNWDYGWNAAYFVTICTKNRESFFGEIVNGEMQLSPIGEIANLLWYEIKNTLSSIVGGYKSAVSKYAHRLEFEWQSLFHDHIIRNEISFYNISEYIKNNPKNWGKDKFTSKNHKK